MTPKVEQVEQGRNTGDELIPWILKRGKRAAKEDKWEQQWYKRWGSSRECSICGERHAAMIRQIDNEHRVKYIMKCPIANNAQWPPEEEDGRERTIWESLEASSYKMASYHHYSNEDISEALECWRNRGAGDRMTAEEKELFKAEVDLWCMMERQTWTFKRTLLTIPEKEDDRQDMIGEMSDEEG
jgi:hypothetical protein